MPELETATIDYTRTPSSTVEYGSLSVPVFVPRDERWATDILSWSPQFIEIAAQALPAMAAGRAISNDQREAIESHGLLTDDGKLNAVADRLAYHLNELDRQVNGRINDSMFDKLRIGPGAVVLDVGAGAGQTLLSMADRKPAECHGIDVDLEVVALGHQVQSLYENDVNRLACGSGDELPFEDEKFTQLICRVALNYMHQANSLREFARVLKPGGYMFIGVERLGFEITMFRQCHSLRELASRSYDVGLGVVTALSGQEAAPGRRITGGRKFATLPWLRRWLNQYGCEILESDVVGQRMKIPTGSRLIVRKHER